MPCSVLARALCKHAEALKAWARELRLDSWGSNGAAQKLWLKRSVHSIPIPAPILHEYETSLVYLSPPFHSSQKNF